MSFPQYSQDARLHFQDGMRGLCAGLSFPRVIRNRQLGIIRQLCFSRSHVGIWDMYQNGNTPNKELITRTLTYNEDDDRLFSSLMRHAI